MEILITINSLDKTTKPEYDRSLNLTIILQNMQGMWRRNEQNSDCGKLYRTNKWPGFFKNKLREKK